MTNLKTLKDLVSWCCECNCVTFDGEVCRSCGKSSPKYGEIDFEDLKQEAIKWVKNWRSEIRYLQEQSLTKDPRDLLTEIKYYEGKIDATMELNNITEKELK